MREDRPSDLLCRHQLHEYAIAAIVGLILITSLLGACQRRCAEFAEWQPDVSTNLEAVLNQADEKRD